MQSELSEQETLLSWLFNSLGLFYTVLLALGALLSFVLALLIVLRGRGPMAAAGLVLIVHLPLLIGAFAAIDGVMGTYKVISAYAGSVKQSEIAFGLSSAFAGPFVGMLLMIPSYAIAALGACIRSLTSTSESGKMPPT